MTVDLRALRNLASRGLSLISASAAAPSGDAALAWRIRQAAPSRAEVYLYGAIDGWALDGNDLAREIRALDVDAIDLRVNSPGGYVFDGVAVYAALVEHRAEVTTHIDGLAASAASFIAQAGATRNIIKPGRMMIHDARAIAVGDPAVMREAAQLLDDISDSIAQVYADRAGETAAVWRQRMRDTTWYGAQQAVAAGLADTVIEPTRPGDDDQGDDDEQEARATARAQMIHVRHRVRTMTARKG